MLNRVRLWLRSVVLRGRLEREMQEEMADHLERSRERLMARGLSAEEARREARREFGNVTYLQEEARYARGTRRLDELVGDVRFALRHFARRLGTTLTMFVVLAVGMSISTLLFSYVHAYAVQPPPGVALADDLVRIRGSQDAGPAGRGARGFSHEELGDYRGMSGHFSAVAGWADAMVALDAGDDQDRSGLDARATFVTSNYFSVLGLKPVLGRIPADDADAAPAAVIGYTTWERLFGKSPEVIGSTIAVNGVPVTVVGVAPERFIGMGPLSRWTLWMPLSARRVVTPGAAGGFRAVGRLRDGVSAGQATAAARVVAVRNAAAEALRAPDADSGEKIREQERSTEVVSLRSASGDPMFERDVRLMSIMVGLLGLLVLLVTCTNVSALLTGLAAARRQEIAIRLSLGAGRARLVRQLLTESALLASAAAVAALGVVWLVLRTVLRLIPEFPLVMGINWAVTLFTFGVALAVGVLFGLSPALHGTRIAVASALRDSSASIAAARARLQKGLVVAQIAFTQPLIVLLAAALLLILGNHEAQSRTERADRLLRMSLRPAGPVTGTSPAAIEERQRLRATMDRLVERLRAAPEVEAAVIDWPRSTPPLGAYFVHPGDRVAGASQNAVQLSGETAAGGYFGALGVPLLRGREFGPNDVNPAANRTAEVPVIINAELARRLWAGADPVGRRLRAASDTAGGARTLVVVGVIDDPRPEVSKAGEGYRVYLPPDTSELSMSMLVRTAGPAEPLIPAIRGVVQEEAPRMSPWIRTVAALEEEGRRNFRMFTFGVSAAGLMALLLSAIGLYGVVAFSVSQRRGEIAVRIAVGARARQIIQKFIGDGLRLSALGLVMGLPISLVGLRALLAADDSFRHVPLPSVTAIAALGVLIVASAAAWIPARKAAAVDPAITLRGG
jgi:predicted permease